jgi:hypothetical protein
MSSSFGKRITDLMARQGVPSKVILIAAPKYSRIHMSTAASGGICIDTHRSCIPHQCSDLFNHSRLLLYVRYLICLCPRHLRAHRWLELDWVLRSTLRSTYTRRAERGRRESCTEGLPLRVLRRADDISDVFPVYLSPPLVSSVLIDFPSETF